LAIGSEINDHDYGRGRADAANRRGQGVSEPGRADQPGPEAETRVRGRERGGWIWIEGLQSYPLWLSLNCPISDGRPRSNGHGRTQARWRRSVPWRELAGDEEAGHGGALEAWGLVWACSGRSGGLSHGYHASAEAPEGTAHDEAG
jgi:hypothetical protein